MWAKDRSTPCNYGEVGRAVSAKRGMSTLWLGVRLVHLPAMALFVGGQLFVAPGRGARSA